MMMIFSTCFVGCLIYGDEISYPVILGDDFINHEIRIPINQPGFNGMSTGFSSLLTCFVVSKFCMYIACI